MSKSGTHSGKPKKGNGYDSIDEASEESFPTSDPPSWTLGSNSEMMAAKISDLKAISQILANEHHVIRNVITALRKLIIHLENHQEIHPTLPKKINEFFLHYVTHCHYLKEEALFPLLHHGAKHPSEYILHDLSYEHQSTDEILIRFNTAATNFSPQDQVSREHFIHALKELCDFESNHIAKEEGYILPAITSILSKEEQQMLLEKFNTIDSNLGQHKREQLNQLADEIIKSI